MGSRQRGRGPDWGPYLLTRMFCLLELFYLCLVMVTAWLLILGSQVIGWIVGFLRQGSAFKEGDRSSK